MPLHRCKSGTTAAVAGRPAWPEALIRSRHELIAGEERVAVTRLEYLLLECLIRHFFSPVALDQLIRYAWPDAVHVGRSNVNVAVTRLRRKLERRLPWVQIETIKRYGYRLAISGERRPATGSRQTFDASLSGTSPILDRAVTA